MSGPRTAMLFAAGLGTRMRPLTAQTAKPLLPLGGRSLLDRALDRLRDAGVERVVVNAHWQVERVAAHLAARADGPETVLICEDQLLDTGGTLCDAVARGLIGGDAPFFVLNGDSAWLDGPVPTLTRLAHAFSSGVEGIDLDALLLLVHATQVQAEINRGDFMLDSMGRPRRPQAREIAPYVFGGVQIVSPRFCRAAAPPPFSLNVLWDRAIEARRVGGLVHDGLWFHLSTPRDLAEAEQALEQLP